MKLLPALFILFCMVLISCGGDHSNTAKNESAKDTSSAAVKGLTAPADEQAQKMEALKKMPTLTIEQISEYLPSEYNGAKQRNYSANSLAGYSFAQSDYRKSPKSELKITVYDVAGDAGVQWLKTSYYNFLNLNQESETEYRKTVDLLGTRAIEQVSKQANESSLTYLVNNRLLVVMQGRNMKPEEVRQAAETLNIGNK